MSCAHENFDVNVNIGRILKEDGDQEVMMFMADITVSCHDCGEKFRFIGLPHGLDMNGAAVSADGTEGRFAIAPVSEVLTMVDGVTGFTARRTH